MPLSTKNPGDIILAADHSEIYNLLKGVSGHGETITLNNNAAGTLRLQPESDPTGTTQLFQVRTSAGSLNLALTAAGAIVFSDGTTQSTGAGGMADGTEAAPGWAFNDDANTGFRRPGTDILNIVTAGADRWQVGANGHLYAADDATYSIGTTGAGRPLNITAAGVLTVPTINSGTTYNLPMIASFASANHDHADGTGGGTITTGQSGAQSASATITGDITTTSTSYVDATGLTVTITTTGGDVLIWFSATVSISIAAGIKITLLKDGTTVAGTDGLIMFNPAAAIDRTSASFVWRDAAPTSASHTYKIQWLVNGGTGTMYGNPRASIVAMELPS